MSLLNNLKKITTKSQKRVGRGYGSGKGGHTASKGQKGQKSRVGANVPLWFEGGQLPIVKRMPFLRGKGRFKIVRPTAEITLNDLQKMDTDIISLETLKLNKIIDPAYKKAKIISTGSLNKKVTVKGLRVSKKAQQIIEKLGGKVE